MRKNYEKPKTEVVLLQGRHHLLQVSKKGMSVGISGYKKGGKDPDDDGWED